MSDGFDITCKNCGASNKYTVHGVSGYGVIIVCTECDNEEKLFW